jgi:hypothetical protein
VILTAFVLTLGVFGAAADGPPPLVKPVTPANGVRVRVPVEENPKTYMQFKATVAKKKGDTFDVKVMIDTHHNSARVELKKWKSWGFDVPNNRIGVIPELIIPSAQISPKPTKGRDVDFRVANVKVNIIESAVGNDAVGGGCDILLSLRDLTGGADRTFEPRFYFHDKFLELTAPGTMVKRLNTGDMTSPDATATAGDLVPAVGTMNATSGSPVFSFASVNSYARYMLTTGKVETVNVSVSTIANYPEPGIVMTLSTAHGCNVELEKQPREGETVTGKVKELRLEMLTGPGFKTKKDLVLREVTVYVSEDKTHSAVILGPRFVEKYLTDGVYGCGSDGVWRLHGRVEAKYLEDPKTRQPQPMPKKQ